MTNDPSNAGASNAGPVSREIMSLVHRGLDEALTEEEVRKVQDALAASDAARRWYAQVVQTHADLLATSKAGELCRLVQDEFPDRTLDGPSHDASVAASPPTGKQRSWLPPFSMAAAMLLSVGFGCGVGLFAANVLQLQPSFLPAPWNWRVGEDVVAKVASTHDARWQSAEAPETLPTRGLRVGQEVRLEQGALELAFRNGVRLLLQGPVVFEVRGEGGGKLYAGRLTATTPAGVDAFHVETPIGRFQLGAGQFGVAVQDSSSRVTSEVHVFSGASPGAPSAWYVSGVGKATEVRDRQAMAFDGSGAVLRIELADRHRFPVANPYPLSEPFLGDEIFLGNLFDDSKTASLTEAMRTDGYRAAGETIDLGVAAVHDGGLDVDVSLAEDGVLFNFQNVGGGGPAVLGLPGNDTFRSTSETPIRTRGEDFLASDAFAKHEEGVGMCPNELITFDLDELRRAGELGTRAMRFLVDRAGINDQRPSNARGARKMSDARFVVLVSTEDAILSAHVDGREYPVTEQSGVYSVDRTAKRLPGKIRYNGQFKSFDVPVPPEARFLTLATTMIDEEHFDHAVFSGARLELSPNPAEQSDAFSRAAAAPEQPDGP